MQETYSLELWLELLLDFIKDQSQPKDSWVVMGNSIGGLLTLMVTEALQGTGTIKGSVLFNSAGMCVYASHRLFSIVSHVQNAIRCSNRLSSTSAPDSL
jgi:alpha-beta hydrolase superfamily lysophospholipase